ncbi:MAG: hypothetical protein ACJZ1R_08185 [Candidatus Neomarinimicrobiota bacterium]
MSDNNFKLVTLVLFFPIFINCMTISVKDSITYDSDSEYIKLSNDFIIESTLKITLNDSVIYPIYAVLIEGKIFLNNIPQNSLLIIEYDCLKKNIPYIVGPKWKDFPTLDTLNISEDSEEHFEKSSDPDTIQTIFSSGSFFRSLSLSPYGGSDFQGGVQMELNGRILKNINISGVLTDQNFPLQDEGNTQDLRDFDNVFLKVQHPNIELDAGDIDYKYSDKFNTINRKLEGLKNEFQFKKWSGSSVYANSKGQFHFIQIKGRDGDQGPYQLVGKDGNRDIAILSGTEQVWVNGEKAIRGKNYDYTIDYSLSEIYFTSRKLIDFDTDIFIEYQYSDFQYQKGLRGITLRNNIGNSSYLSLGFFDEFDQLNQIDLGSEKFNTFFNNDISEVTISTALPDSTGDYIFFDSIYIYDPYKSYIDFSRYQIRFVLDPEGNYLRKISDENKIYYETIGESDISEIGELYSPYRIITSPVSQQFGKAQFNLNIHERLRIEGQLSGSRLNKNIIGNYNPSNGISHFVNIHIDTIGSGLFKLKLSYKNQKRGKEYLPLGREQEVMQTRLWNIDKIILKNSDEHYFQTNFIIEKLGTSDLEFAKLTYDNKSLKRFRFYQSLSHIDYKNSFIDFTHVDNTREYFYRALVNLERNRPHISPNISFISEQHNLDHRFQKTGVGFKIKSKDSYIGSGLEQRIDEEYEIGNNWSFISKDLIAYTDISSNTEEGWKKNISFKQRIKKSNVNQNYNYSLLDLDLSWKKRNSPFSCFINLNKEENLSQNRTVIYEYVGPGLGNYRYDSDLNTYVYDLNGDYVSFTINIGKRSPKTNFLGSQRFTIELFKNNILPLMIIKSQNTQEFKGKSFSLSKIGETNILDTDISKAFLFSRNEIIIPNSKFAMIWFQYKKNLEGHDPRGNNIKIDKEIGMENILKFLDNSSFKNNINVHDYSIDSKVYPERKRDIFGFWNDFTWQIKLKYKIDVLLGLISGVDKGIVYGKSFNAKGIGIKSNIIFYLKQNGRFQTEVAFINVVEENNYAILPPEVLKGYAYGQSLKTNSRLQYLLNQSLSFNLNLNTINDMRYKNMITLQGEVRAYF